MQKKLKKVVTKEDDLVKKVVAILVKEKSIGTMYLHAKRASMTML